MILITFMKKLLEEIINNCFILFNYYIYIIYKDK